MAAVLYLPEAQEDLHSLWRYLVENSKSIETADRLIDAIDDACQQYARQPLMGDARPDLASEVRCFRVGKHVVFYIPTAHGIEVVQVIHGARDIPIHFRGERFN